MWAGKKRVYTCTENNVDANEAITVETLADEYVQDGRVECEEEEEEEASHVPTLKEALDAATVLQSFDAVTNNTYLISCAYKAQNQLVRTQALTLTNFHC